jgi:hypothetical protein
MVMDLKYQKIWRRRQFFLKKVIVFQNFSQLQLFPYYLNNFSEFFRFIKKLTKVLISGFSLTFSPWVLIYPIENV